MISKVYNKIRKITGAAYINKSYAQCGEDLVISFLAEKFRWSKFSYLDIGTNHPKKFNNTYLFYKRGCRGVCVEPDVELVKSIEMARRGDKVFNVGLSAGEESAADFYVMTVNTLNTFSKEDAEKLDREGIYKIKKVVKVPLKNINSIIEEGFGNKTPNVISLDVEGWNEEIIRSLDFEKYKPEVLCVETVTFATDNTESKVDSIIDYVKSRGYFVYADTFINTIFINQKFWDSLK